MNVLHLIYYGLDYSRHFYKQHRFIKTYLEPEVAACCELLQYHFSPLEKGKVFRYYPQLSVCALAEMYILLKRRKLTLAERQRVTLMSAMATLCDDLVDEGGWTEQDLLRLLNGESEYRSLPLKAKLITALNEKFKNIGVPTRYWQQLKTAFEGQAASIRQHQANLTLEETIAIARKKNGNYCLLVASLLDAEWTPLEEQIIYHHGIIGQIGNDVYDSFKDIQHGIYTIVRKVENMAQLKQVFLQETAYMHDMIMQTSLPASEKKYMIRKLTCVDAFTLYGINQLQDVEDKYQLPIPWQDVTRKELVIDMEINANRWKYIRGAIALSKKAEARLLKNNPGFRL